LVTTIADLVKEARALSVLMHDPGYPEANDLLVLLADTIEATEVERLRAIAAAARSVISTSEESS
jgi:hypothetical protein